MIKPTKPAPRVTTRLAPAQLRAIRGGANTTYQKIEWTWNDGGITAGDDWEARI